MSSWLLFHGLGFGFLELYFILSGTVFYSSQAKVCICFRIRLRFPMGEDCKVVYDGYYFGVAGEFWV